MRLPWPRCKYCGSELYGQRECPCARSAMESSTTDTKTEEEGR
jgi:hypothetical protein